MVAGFERQVVPAPSAPWLSSAPPPSFPPPQSRPSPPLQSAPVISTGVDVSGVETAVHDPASATALGTPRNNRTSLTRSWIWAVAGIVVVVALVVGLGLVLRSSSNKKALHAASSQSKAHTSSAGSTPPATVAAVLEAFNTVYNSESSVSQDVSNIQDGSTLETALSTVISFSRVLSVHTGNVAWFGSAGVHASEVTELDRAECATKDGLTTSCVEVGFSILKQTGSTASRPQYGFAIAENGRWLIDKHSVCANLDLAYAGLSLGKDAPGCGLSGAGNTGNTSIGSTDSTG